MITTHDLFDVLIITFAYDDKIISVLIHKIDQLIDRNSRFRTIPFRREYVHIISFSLVDIFIMLNKT